MIMEYHAMHPFSVRVKNRLMNTDKKPDKQTDEPTYSKMGVLSTLQMHVGPQL